MSARKRHIFRQALLGATALLALYASETRAAADTRSWRPATNTALEFEISGGGLTDFDGGTISWRRQHGEHAVWRIGCEVNGAHIRRKATTRDESGYSFSTRGGEDNVSLSAQITRLSFPLPERRLRPWFGFLLGGSNSRYGREESEPNSSLSNRVRLPYVYGAALAGLEYSIASRFALHAQYGQGAQYYGQQGKSAQTQGNSQTSSSTQSSWQLYSTGARFGIAVFY